MVFACKHEAAGSVAEVAVERAFHRVPGPECWLLLRTPTELWAGLNGNYGGSACRGSTQDATETFDKVKNYEYEQ